MSQAVGTFITELMTHFPFRHESPEKEKLWIDSMVRNLRGYDSDVLAKAAQQIVDRRTDRRFPLPAECKKVCEEVIKWRELEKPRLDQQPQEKFAGHHDWQYRLADDLIMCGLGKRAAAEGWILSLHDFCRNNGRLPNSEYEIRKCIDGARGFDEAFEDVLRGVGGVCAKSLAGLGDAMLKRRESLRARVTGRE